MISGLAVMRSTAIASLLAAALVGCSSADDTALQASAGGKNEPPTYQAFTKPANAYSHGEPTELEQGLLELIQRARANPPAEGGIIVNDGDPDVANNMKAFKVDPQQVVADFETYSAVPPLAFDPALMQSSRFHSLDMAAKGFQQHNGSAGESFDQRITKAGYKWSFVSENIFSYAKNIIEAHDAFLIDWGNPDLGHRKALLDLEGRQRDIGISIVEMSGPNNVGPLVVTQDFGHPADDSKRYVLGVVYQDKNVNGAYEPGEGLAGYSVVGNTGDFFAVTSMSGGYAIPFPKNQGPLSVQVQTPEGVAVDQHVTALVGENVKVDFVLPQ
jgi:hypothetical protein